ncbi:YitT family protein [Marinicrinis lubricantis]|uniref:YitT family protein n=1 Tax=Marinicrinis lubricantis TaxID=2086470 RepID=A0ABW1ILY5_9BACL
MFKTNWKPAVQQIFPILLGTAIYAFGLHFFVIPNELMEGGVTGISLLLKYALNIPPSYTTLIINVPLFYVGWKYVGKQPMYYTILGTLSLSFFLWVIEFLMHKGWVTPFRYEEDYLLAALYAGVTLGAGLGLVFRFGGTTGGSDIIARICNKKMGWSMGQVILFIDAIVIGTSAFYIPIEKIFYTLVVVFIAAKMIDFIQEGAYAAKAFTIISDKPVEISQRISDEMDRGMTFLSAKGGYSRMPKEVVYCVVSRQEVRRLKSIVRQVDPRAFMIISDVHDVLGEGFRVED